MVYGIPVIRDPSLKVETVVKGLTLPTSMAILDENNMLVLEKDSGNVRLTFGTGFKGITDIETGPDGSLYLLSFGDGALYKISKTSVAAYFFQQTKSIFQPISFYEEDGFIENLTAIVFLMSGLVGLLVYCRNPKGQARWISLCVLGIGILGFLDELSFGMRFVGWKPVPVGDSAWKPLDSIHDFGAMGLEVFVRLPLAVTLLSVIGGAIILLFVSRKKLKNLFRTSKAVAFIFVSLAAILAALVIEESFKLLAPEETSELIAGLAIYCAAFIRLIEVESLRSEAKKAIVPRQRKFPLSVLPTLFGIALFACSIVLSAFFAGA
jgi:hypothetical protein